MCILVVLVAALARASLHWRMTMHATVIRASKIDHYNQMSARAAMDICQQQDLMEEADASAFCAAARAVVGTPLEDLVAAEAWDRTTTQVWNVITGLTAKVLGVVLVAVVVLSILRCTVGIVLPGAGSVLP